MNPVDLEIGPNGDLFYVDFDSGTIHRITYAAPGSAPTASISATPPNGSAPLAVAFSGAGSSDPDGGALTYAWDLDGDGQLDDSNAVAPSWTYASDGNYVVTLRVTDPTAATGTATTTIVVDSTLPQPVIDTPSASLTWAVGDPIAFTGHATRSNGSALPASALTWSLVLHHCPSNCHTHTVQSWVGVAGATVAAPDHDYPSYLELVLTATDGTKQATVSRQLDPKTVALSFATSPSGLQLSAGTTTATAPFTKTVIQKSAISITAPPSQTVGATTYAFASWSDGGAATHQITSPTTAATYTATYSPVAGTTSYLSDLAYTVTANGWGPPEKDRSNGEDSAADGLPLTLEGVVYAKGIGAHAASDIRYTMSGCTAFSAKVGVDDEVLTRGSIVFQVYADGTKVFDSGTMTGSSPTQTVALDMTGRAALRLVITNAGDNFTSDHGDWADAKLTCGGTAPDTTPPTVTATSPANGATGVLATTVPSATFSEALNAATVTAANVTLTDQATSAAVAGAVSYDSATRTVRFTPTAALGAGKAYLARVKGGASGIADSAGNRLVADVTWSFTVAAAPDTTPPTVTATSPANGATGVLATTVPSATFSEALNAATVTAANVTLTDQATSAAVAGAVSYDSATRTVRFTPTAALGAGKAYLARVKGGASGIADSAGNRLVADVTWSFTVAAATGGTTSYLSDLAYTVTANGWGPPEKDRSNGEDSAADGLPLTLEGVVYAKGIGAHAASDIRYTMSGCTAFSAKVGVDDEVLTRGSIVFQVYADGTKVFDSGTMTGSSPTQTVALDMTGRAALRLVITNAGDNFTSDHGDWADAKLTCGGTAPDTTPPTVTATSPANGATGVLATTVPSATFSEALNAATVTAANVTLTDQATSAAVAGAVSYDSATRTVRFTPTAALGAGKAYLARVKGGASGIADSAGNRLVADVTWSFTVAAAPDTTPPTVTATSPANGATGVLATTVPSATFSEALNAATVTAANVTLTDQATSAAVAGAVSYDSATRTVRFTPTAALGAGKAYLARVKGGASGIADSAGNRLVADVTWSFTVAAATGGTTSYLSDLAYTVTANGWGPPEKDRSNGEDSAADGLPLTLEGVVYAKGIGAHAASDIRYTMSGCTAFSAKVGVDDEVLTRGSIVFQVYADGTKVFDSGTMTGSSPTQTVALDMTGRAALRLVITNAGDNFTSDHGDWADAKLTCG